LLLNSNTLHIYTRNDKNNFWINQTDEKEGLKFFIEKSKKVFSLKRTYTIAMDIKPAAPISF